MSTRTFYPIARHLSHRGSDAESHPCIAALRGQSTSRVASVVNLLEKRPAPIGEIHRQQSYAPLENPKVRYTFKQDAFDASGEIVGPGGRAVYQLEDEGREHKLHALKPYPLHIVRTDGSRLASIHWGYVSDGTRLEPHAVWQGQGKIKYKGGIFDDNLTITLPTGKQYRWEMDLAADPPRWQLLDTSLDTAVAVYRMRSKRTPAALELPPEQIGLLEPCVMTIFYLEYISHGLTARMRTSPAGQAQQPGGPAAKRAIYSVKGAGSQSTSTVVLELEL
ncbi:hypothetical protein HDZ31DRAFT_80589 [Schizophyllum fasciatum]